MSDLIVEFRGYEVKVINVDYSPGCNAKTSGPPENCYPGESAEISYTVDSGCELLDVLLTEDFDEEFEEAAFETIAQNMQDEKDEAAISRYEDRVNE